MTILDDQTGSILFQHQNNIGLPPASSMKTITAAAAIHYLGEEFSYSTTLKYSGTIDHQTGFLDGFIYLVGEIDFSFQELKNKTTDDYFVKEVEIRRWEVIDSMIRPKEIFSLKNGQKSSLRQEFVVVEELLVIQRFGEQQNKSKSMDGHGMISGKRKFSSIEIRFSSSLKSILRNRSFGFKLERK